MNTYRERFKTPAQRFWEKIDRDGQAPSHCPSLGKCWKWKAGKFRNGYAAFHIMQNGIKKVQKGHRFSYELHFGKIPNEMLICHKCDNPECCNPEHLFPGTAKDNIGDAARKGRMRSGDRHPLRMNPEIITWGHKISKRMRELWITNRASYMEAVKKRNYNGQHGPNSRLKLEQVLEIRRIYSSGPASTTELGLKYNVCHSTIARIVNRNSWNNV